MVSSLTDLDSLIATHQEEASLGIVDVAPSRLLRGQGTEKNFYILKIDLVGSTMMLLGRHKGTYLKLAHTFLSTVDQITKDFGADSNQTEYAGDSVLAYFPESVSAESVLKAACYAKVAVERIARLQSDQTLSRMNCRVVVHYASLIIAKIGPRAGSFLNAMGQPLHRVAKIEKGITAGTGRVTQEFYKRIQRVNLKFFTAAYHEESVQVTPSHSTNLGLFLSPQERMAQMLYGPLSIPTQPQYRINRTLIGYDINWQLLKAALNLNPPIRLL